MPQPDSRPVPFLDPQELARQNNESAARDHQLRLERLLRRLQSPGISPAHRRLPT